MALDHQYPHRFLPPQPPPQYRVAGAVEIGRHYTLLIPVRTVAGDIGHVILSRSQVNALIEDIENAHREADDQEQADIIADGIDSGDLDAHGDPIPYPRYRAA